MRLHLFPPVNVDWCYLAVTACKFALQALRRVTTLTERGEGGEVTGAKMKHLLCGRDKGY